MSRAGRIFAILGGVGSAGIALLQPVIYIGGPPLYLLLGAPPYLADLRASEPGRMLLWSAFWFGLFTGFALYGFSAAGLIRRLPFLRAGLAAIATTYAIRGLAVAPQLIWFGEFPVTHGRDVAFSLLSIVLAVSYALAARQQQARVAA